MRSVKQLETIKIEDPKGKRSVNMQQLETIKIEDPKGKRDFVIINKKDFDPEIHVEFGTRPAPEPEPVRKGRKAK